MLSLESEAETKLCSMVIRNFLNYVLQHEVCPEYTEDIMAARKICGVAERELWAMKNLSIKLPGGFNIALSTIFGGHYRSTYLAEDHWEPRNYCNRAVQDMASARLVFDKGVQYLIDNGMAWKDANSIVKSTVKFYEVVDIKLSPDEELGAIKCKSWEGPGLDEEEAFDDESPIEILGAAAGSVQNETFWLEPAVLCWLSVGMKLEAVVVELDNGFKFLDSVGAFCSFYTYLENEKMGGYREPGKK
jgi:hypothetical protein